MSSSSDTLVAQPRFLHPRQLPPWVPSNQMHLAFQTGSRNVHAFQGPRPKLTSSWGLGVTRWGEDSSKRLISHPWSDTHSMRTFWPRTPAHPAAPAPGQWVPPVQPHPRSRAAPLASGQVSPGSGSPAPPQAAHLAEDPAALYRRPGLRLRILLRARRVPALVIRHGGATGEQETGPRSASCASAGAQSLG